MSLVTFSVSLVLIVLGAGLIGHFLGPKLNENAGQDTGSAVWFARRMKRKAASSILAVLVIALVVFIYPLGCMLGVPWNVLRLSPQVLFILLFTGGGVLMAVMVVLYSRGRE